MFGIGLTALTLLYYVNAQHVFSSSQYVYWYRFGHLGLVLFVATIVISEYREQERLVQKVKFSKYITNLRADENRLINGALLRVDLKGSKKLEAEAARKGIGFGYGTITGEWLSAMFEAIFRAGGEVLSDRGDEFLAFFDDTTFRSQKILFESVLRDMVTRQRSVERILGIGAGRMQFRATIVTGKLWVGWKNRIPGYDGDVMAESARVLDLEKQLASDQKSILVIEKANSAVVPFDEASYQVAVKTDKEGGARSLVWFDLAGLEVLAMENGEKKGSHQKGSEPKISTETPST
jgi:class 3 adenylate cyclase